MTTQRRTKPAARESSPAPTKVLAVQVKRPYRSVTSAFPRSHRHNKPNGHFDYFRLLDAPAGMNRAYDGDWLIKLADGTSIGMRDSDFQSTYGSTE